MGAALVTVVLITLALFAIGHALLVLSLGELSASRAAQRHLEARSAAESAVHRSLATPGASWMDSVAMQADRSIGSWSIGRARAAARVWRLSRESWWLEGTGSVGVATARTARLAWALDPLARVLELDAVLTLGVDAPLALDGTVDPSAPAVVEAPLPTGACDPWIDTLAVRYAGDPLDAVARLAPPDTAPRLGSLDFGDLLAAATVEVAGTGSPQPSETLGTCDALEPWSWGDPDHPWRPCGGDLVLRAARGDLEVTGGAGQGVLLVDGDLTVGGGSRFYGLVLVRGALRVRGGGQLIGMAVATGGAYVASGSAVRGSACWATRALAARRADLGALRLTEGVGPLAAF
ncbi:MAG: hypothetical protein AB7T31_16210 [Gemmatimonadales bacterium]